MSEPSLDIDAFSYYLLESYPEMMGTIRNLLAAGRTPEEIQEYFESTGHGMGYVPKGAAKYIKEGRDG